MMSGLVDFGFVGEIFVELFFRLVVLCLCAAYKIIAVLWQSQVNLCCFLRLLNSHCVLTLIIQRAQEFSWVSTGRKVLVLGLRGVHPGETEVLDGAHIDLCVLGFDLLFAWIRIYCLIVRGKTSGKVTPHCFKLCLVLQVWFSNEAHLKQCLKCLSNWNVRFIRNVVVVIHLLQIAFESFENDVLRICWHWLHFFNFILVFFCFRGVLPDLVSTFGVIGKNFFYSSCSNNRLRRLVNLRLVSWLYYCGGLSTHWRFFYTILFLLKNFFAFFADLWFELRTFLIFFFQAKSQLVESLGFEFYLVC
jgi:hypothetical protein